MPLPSPQAGGHAGGASPERQGPGGSPVRGWRAPATPPRTRQDEGFVGDERQAMMAAEQLHDGVAPEPTSMPLPTEGDKQTRQGTPLRERRDERQAMMAAEQLPDFVAPELTGTANEFKNEPDPSAMVVEATEVREYRLLKAVSVLAAVLLVAANVALWLILAPMM